MFRIMIVDDNFEFLRSAARFLATDPRILVVGLALSGSEALLQVTRLRPDLVLMDIAMPQINGLEVTRSLKSRFNAPHIVILTHYDTIDYRNAAAAAGADGFIPKSEFGAEVLPLIHSLLGTLPPDVEVPSTNLVMEEERLHHDIPVKCTSGRAITHE